MSDLVGNPDDQFSQVATQFVLSQSSKGAVCMLFKSQTRQVINRFHYYIQAKLMFSEPHAVLSKKQK